MKKLFAFLASALMVLSLAACSNNGGGNNDKPADDGRSRYRQEGL